MSAVPRYLQRAREAMAKSSSVAVAPLPTRNIVPGAQPSSPVWTEREKSEESEKRSRFSPGGRYRVEGPVVGVIHRSDEAFDEWRVQMGMPRAAIMTIQGEQVIVADVRAALRSGFVEVVGVRVVPR